MKILVSGGAGYIGSVTVEALRQRGDTVIVIDDLSSGHRGSLHPSIKLYQESLCDAEAIHTILAKEQPNAVVHFAAYTSVPESVKSPEKYFVNNVQGSFNLLEAMRMNNVLRFVFSSTAAVYGEPLAVPINETHPKQPTSPYGMMKLFIEQLLDAYEAAYGFKSVCLRYFNACGSSIDRGEDHTPETHLIPIILQTALGIREKVLVYGVDYPTPDGTCIRDYIHVEDLAKAHLLALDRLLNDGLSLRVNLGNGKGHSVFEVIEMARKVTGRDILLQIQPRRDGDPSTLVASSELAIRELGWRPAFSDLETMIKSAWDWHFAHPKGYENC